MRLFLVLGLFLLGGCAAIPTNKEYIDRPVEVLVEVRKPCLNATDVVATPVILLDTVEFTSAYPVTDALKAARADRITMRTYVEQTQKVMKECAK